MNSIVIFESGDQPVQVRLEGETVWLTQALVAARSVLIESNDAESDQQEGLFDRVP